MTREQPLSLLARHSRIDMLKKHGPTLAAGRRTGAVKNMTADDARLPG